MKKKILTINFGRFLISVISGIAAWAITGCIAGFNNSNPILTIFSIIILSGFSAFVILSMIYGAKDKFIQAVEKASKNSDWLQVYTLCEPLSSALWKMSKLRLRVKIAEKMKEAVGKIGNGISEINDKPFNYYQKMASIYIDDLGYTKYMLANNSNEIRNAIQNINDGIAFAEDKRVDSINSYVYRLKGLRHLVAIFNDGRYPDNENGPIDKFEELISKIEDYLNKEEKDNFLFEQLQCSKYAYYKYELNQTKEIETINCIINKINELNEMFKTLKKSEWQEKCEQLIWEVQYNRNDDRTLIEKNMVQIEKKLDECFIWPNRRIKLLNLYIKYVNLRMKNHSYDSLYNLNNVKDKVNNLIIKYKKVIIHCENSILKNQLEEEIDLFYKTLKYEKRRIKSLKIMDHYDTFLFDCDYTIYNYKKAQSIALKKALKENSLKYKKKYDLIFNEINEECWLRHEADKKYELIREERIRKFLSRIEENDIDENSFLKKMETEMSRPILMPGAKKILETCSSKNKNIFIVTDADKVKRTIILKPFIIKGIIKEEHIISKEDCEGHSKKEEKFFDLLEKKYNIRSKESIIVGDSIENDLTAASKKNYTTCLVNLGHKYKTGVYETDNLNKISYVVKKINHLKNVKIKNKF